MSNPLSVRRIQVQTIDKDGKPVGEPSYGVVASDNEGTVFADCFESQEELEAAISDSASILALVDPDERFFPNANHEKIGKDNFYGKDWYN